MSGIVAWSTIFNLICFLSHTNAEYLFSLNLGQHEINGIDSDTKNTLSHDFNVNKWIFNVPKHIDSYFFYFF